MHSPPLLRWAGSKRKLLPELQHYWRPHHQRYIEPFAGSACLFFYLQPRRAVLGDLNRELILTYREIKYRTTAVITELSRLGTGDRETYLVLREQSPENLERSARAARFIYLNRFCFNGIYRTNQSGRFNVPYGGQGSGSLPSPEALHHFSKKLRFTKLIAGDFERVLTTARPGDLVYMDPPYATTARRVFREYHPDAFVPSDVARLRIWLDRLTESGVDFIVSYGSSPEADFLARGYTLREVSVRRNVAGFASHRKISSELLITNFRGTFA